MARAKPEAWISLIARIENRTNIRKTRATLRVKFFRTSKIYKYKNYSANEIRLKLCLRVPLDLSSYVHYKK